MKTRLPVHFEIIKRNLRHVLDFYVEELTIVSAWWAWNIPFQLISILITMLIYYYYAMAFGGRSLYYDVNFMSFIIVGLLMNGFLDISMNAYYEAMAALYMGKQGIGGQVLSRIDYLYLAKVSPYAFIFARISFAYFTQIIISLLYLMVGLVFGFKLSPSASLDTAILFILLGSVACSGVGLISASMYWLVGAYRGIEPIRWLVRVLTPLVSGVYLPIDVLPDKLRLLSLFIPQTYAINGARKALLYGSTLAQLKSNAIMLVLFSLTLIPLGLVMLKYSLYLARRRGTIY